MSSEVCGICQDGSKAEDECDSDEKRNDNEEAEDEGKKIRLALNVNIERFMLGGFLTKM